MYTLKCLLLIKSYSANEKIRRPKYYLYVFSKVIFRALKKQATVRIQQKSAFKNETVEFCFWEIKCADLSVKEVAAALNLSADGLSRRTELMFNQDFQGLLIYIIILLGR